MKSTTSKQATTTNKVTLKKPVQKRSQATLDRIFAATEELLTQQRFSEISIAEIARAAKCGVGTVYGRFENKQALLDSMEIRVVQDIVDRQQTFTGSRDWTSANLEERVTALTEHIAEGYRIHGPVLRELIGRVHQQTGGAADHSRTSMNLAFDRNIEFLLDGLGKVNKRKARKTIGLALMAVIVTLQNRMLQFDTSPIEQTFSDKFLKTELSAMVIAYLRSSFE